MHTGRRGVVSGREGELEESSLYEVNHMCVYEGWKECIPAISLERHAKMFCQEMEIKIGMVPAPSIKYVLTGRHVARSMSPLSHTFYNQIVSWESYLLHLGPQWPGYKRRINTRPTLSLHRAMHLRFFTTIFSNTLWAPDHTISFSY